MTSTDHVLIVDDDAEIRGMLSEYLRRHGYRVSTAANGSAMWAVLGGEAPDLIVLDLMLPDDDGLTLCRNLRARSSVPIIILTARGGQADRIAGFEAGADDYMTKPFNPRELLARGRNILRRRRSMRATPAKVEAADA
jgi:two-component system OmpR family response regulator